MIDLYWTLVQLVPLLIVAYLYINRKYSFWSSRNVPGPRAIFPLGYQFQKAFADPLSIELSWSRLYGKVYGVYTGLVPTLTITDADLIKQVLVRDFHLFVDRRVLNSYHNIWNLNLFSVESKHWKRIRSIASPTFTSGKLRSMYPLMNRCVGKLVDYLDRVPTNPSGPGVINAKEVITGFTIDVIASTSFATDTDANGDRAKSNSFVFHGMNFFKINPAKLAAVFGLPRWILQSMGIAHIFPVESMQFFINLSRKVIQQRKENPAERRNDLLQLLMDSFVYETELKDTNYGRLAADMDREEISHEISQQTTTNSTNKSKRTLTENEIIAQCIVFFVAGFETTASAITHAIFELAKNPEIQEKLHENLAQELANFPGDLEKDSAQLSEYCDRVLNKVPYLEAVIKETLRKYPPVVRIDRRLAVDDYKLGGISLEKDVLIEVPTVSVHYNPEYYPEPEKFNPDRFLPENKDRLVPYTYLPFGAGPRNCIGMRFAYQEIKLCLAKVVQLYKFAPTNGTPEKLEFLTGSFMLNSKSFPVSVEKRF